MYWVASPSIVVIFFSAPCTLIGNTMQFSILFAYIILTIFISTFDSPFTSLSLIWCLCIADLICLVNFQYPNSKSQGCCVVFLVLCTTAIVVKTKCRYTWFYMCNVSLYMVRYISNQNFESTNV